VVLMDNLSPHKAPRVRELIEQAGYQRVFLPPYFPNFSPIEEAWSKIKMLLRGLAARTRETIDAALANILGRITAADCCGWFHDRGGYGAAPN
jgi:transposase